MLYEIVLVLVPLYLLLVQALRYRRVASIRQITRGQMERDLELCHKVLRVSAADMPLIIETGTAFGLFRTYAIPTISRLLDATGQFKHHCAKRYEDTDLLLSEMTENPLGKQRAEDAVKRMNEIHGHYKISNDDFLYTLTVFVCEPIRWTDRFGWRTLTAPEKDAFAIYWRNIGVRMGLTGVPKDLEAFFELNEHYEATRMQYSKHNENVARDTMALFVSKIPLFLVNIGNMIIVSLFDDRLAAAMGKAPAPYLIKQAVHGFMRLRARFIRYFMLPRWSPRFRTPKDKDPVTGRFMPNFTIYGNIYPNGYTLADLGPTKLAAAAAAAHNNNN